MRLYQRILGERFTELAPEIQALHAQVGIKDGEITLRVSPLMQLLGYPPPCKDAPMWFATREEDDTAIWLRQIKDRELRSELWQAGPHIAERMGAVTVTSALVIEAGAVRLEPKAVRFFDIPLPKVLWPRVEAREWGDSGKYRFKIEVRAPLAGFVLLAYEGWLTP